MLRRAAYRTGILRSHRVACPLIVIGNVTVGGTGKTPFVIWMTRYLQQRGLRVGVVLRGYGGGSTQWPRDVYPDTSPAEVGDEAVLHAQRADIVVAGPDRVAAASRAAERGADVILSDDGLQHYRLARDAEIAVIDAQRELGNRFLLPAGPLREPATRLRETRLIVRTARSDAVPAALVQPNEAVARVRLTHAVSLVTGERRLLSDFAAVHVHAVAGIGNPSAFFSSLRAAGLDIDAHELPDHAALTAADVVFPDAAPVLMTQKDAVKCGEFADGRHWFVELELVLADTDAGKIAMLIDDVLREAGGKR